MSATGIGNPSQDTLANVSRLYRDKRHRCAPDATSDLHEAFRAMKAGEVARTVLTFD
jgi:hypothetical protein